MTNPYLRAAEQFPEIKAQAVTALEARQANPSAEAESVREEPAPPAADESVAPDAGKAQA